MIKLDINKLIFFTLNEIGGILQAQAIKNLDKISYGRVYIIGGKKHIASKAGDSPNNMTGALRKTVRYEIKGNVLEFGAGNRKVNYAKYLELGTGKMDARPNVHKSILQNKHKIELAIKAQIKEMIKNA